MQYQQNQQLQSTKPVKNTGDPKEVERILMQYAGIFKRNIKEYGETIAKKHKKQINFSR